MFDTKVTRNSGLFEWASHFHSAAETNMLPCSSQWSDLELVSEFSGSGCAEAAIHSTCTKLGVKVHHRYAADIDQHCREVLLKSRLGPITE